MQTQQQKQQNQEQIFGGAPGGTVLLCCEVVQGRRVRYSLRLLSRIAIGKNGAAARACMHRARAACWQRAVCGSSTKGLSRRPRRHVPSGAGSARARAPCYLRCASTKLHVKDPVRKRPALPWPPVCRLLPMTPANRHSARCIWRDSQFCLDLRKGRRCAGGGCSGWWEWGVGWEELPLHAIIIRISACGRKTRAPAAALAPKHWHGRWQESGE